MNCFADTPGFIRYSSPRKTGFIRSDPRDSRSDRCRGAAARLAANALCHQSPRPALNLGIEESEAKSQIALCLGEEMDQMVRKRRSFDENAYRASLDALPMEVDDEVENAEL
jgi:hypothetical protein